MSSTKIIESWKTAEKDLKIKIQSPFSITTKKNKRITFDLFIEHFGCEKGIIIMLITKIHGLKAIRENGYSYSALNFDSYSIYNRQHFIDTLNDWGYFGDSSNIPEWYSGQPWTK